MEDERQGQGGEGDWTGWGSGREEGGTDEINWANWKQEIEIPGQLATNSKRAHQRNSETTWDWASAGRHRMHGLDSRPWLALLVRKACLNHTRFQETYEIWGAPFVQMVFVNWIIMQLDKNETKFTLSKGEPAGFIRSILSDTKSMTPISASELVRTMLFVAYRGKCSILEQ